MSTAVNRVGSIERAPTGAPPGAEGSTPPLWIGLPVLLGFIDVATGLGAGALLGACGSLGLVALVDSL